MATQEERNMKRILKNLPAFSKFKRLKIQVKNWKYFVNKGNSWNNPEHITSKKFQTQFHAVNRKN